MKFVFPLIILIGIGVRFIVHYLYPAFNVDEISLGNNIKHKGFLELLYPLDFSQSAPPLYLLLQRILVLLPIPFWISVKLLSFIVSSLSLLVAWRFTQKIFHHTGTQILFLLVFALNPFIIYHSLTVKQYGVDLLFVLLCLSYLSTLNRNRNSWLFFMVWCLLSNIGLFFTAGFILWRFIVHVRKVGFNIPAFIADNNYFNLKLLLAPLPYVFYFVWYMQQEGASEFREYMVSYWQDSFLPLNTGIFAYVVAFIHRISYHFVSAHFILSSIGIIGILAGFGLILFKRNLIKNRGIILLMLCGVLVHVFLNALQMYPLGERLYLYLAPIVLAFFLIPFDLLKQKFNYIAISIAMLAITVSYYFYLPYKMNDVVALYGKALKNNYGEFVCSPRAFKHITRFNDFSDEVFNKGINFSTFDTISMTLKPESYYVATAHRKLGKNNKTYFQDEDITLAMVDAGKLKLVDSVQGYNIYQTLRP